MLSLIHFFFGIVVVSNVFAQGSYDAVTDPRKRAGLAFASLQDWYNTSTGLWESTGWWNGANIMTMIGDYARADAENEELQKMAEEVFANALSKAPVKNPQPGIEDPSSNSTTSHNTNATGYTKNLISTDHEPCTIYPPNWHSPDWPSSSPRIFLGYKASHPDAHAWLDGFYDDDLWWSLAFLSAYDTTQDTTYLHLAESIFLLVSRTWGTYCSSGGIYWSWEKSYVNAIANELFFSAAAHLAHRVSPEKKALYTQWAEKSLTWFLNSGMLNDEGTVNDGLDDDCENNGLPIWSYNQGVILGGLVELYAVSPDPTYLSLARRIAFAALEQLSDEQGVIHDGCEPDCGADAAQFKGVFMRNLILLHQASPDALFERAIRKNANSIWLWDREDVYGGVLLSVDWAGPFVPPANASTHSSAMDALVADISLG